MLTDANDFIILAQKWKLSHIIVNYQSRFFPDERERLVDRGTFHSSGNSSEERGLMTL